ncbi:helix-turn-helix domain-containing protein [Weissella thailandensis]|uniref:XRE family transcriptional regulator n=1 Tax=Weissella thailandensis TaxID=89061 RepID=A0ABX9I603_9LACO|nr:helix-turn-helix transcriptional regulator [Weissella thailandensis]NKY90578.1 helix-turn-helix transcriptional regulator [Weissella thailandensis]RDS60140.1 XRE family transcriptional regulator [Weissella thailandensis]GEP73765.1 hypothetical protein WTH01_00120 [Weissella thailandensis]
MSYVDEKTLAKAFREWRRKNQYSMRAAAKAANMTVPAVQRIEQGAIPELRNLQRVGAVFHMTGGQVFDKYFSDIQKDQ